MMPNNLKERTEDNGRFVSCGADKLVFLWDVTTGKTIRKFQGHDSVIKFLNNNFYF
jgi:mitogen-activated protein kinase organizer 1